VGGEPWAVEGSSGERTAASGQRSANAFRGSPFQVRLSSLNGLGECRSLDSLRSLGMTALAPFARDDRAGCARSG